MCSRSLSRKKKCIVARQRIHSPWMLVPCCPQATLPLYQLYPAMQSWCIRNEFISCFLCKLHAEIPHQPSCRENWPWREDAHNAGVYLGIKEHLSSLLLLIMNTQCKIVPRYVTQSQLDWRHQDKCVCSRHKPLSRPDTVCSNNGLQDTLSRQVMSEVQTFTSVLGCKRGQKMPCLWILWKVLTQCYGYASMSIHTIWPFLAFEMCKFCWLPNRTESLLT